MPKMQDMLAWHVLYLCYKNPALEEAGTYTLYKEFKKTNWKSKEAMAFFAGWRASFQVSNVRIDDLLSALKVGRAKDV